MHDRQSSHFNIFQGHLRITFRNKYPVSNDNKQMYLTSLKYSILPIRHYHEDFFSLLQDRRPLDYALEQQMPSNALWLHLCLLSSVCQ